MNLGWHYSEQFKQLLPCANVSCDAREKELFSLSLAKILSGEFKKKESHFDLSERSRSMLSETFL